MTDTKRNTETVSRVLTVQYNLQNLQPFVKELGLRPRFDRMLLIVEFAFDTCMSRGGGQNAGC